MKLRYYRCWYDPSTQRRTSAKIEANEELDAIWETIWQNELRKPSIDYAVTMPMAIEKALYRPYTNYLIDAFVSDFQSNDIEAINTTFKDIEKLERGEIEVAYAGGLAFNHTLTRTEVSFEHSIFNECEVWPIWSCPLAHYKAALEGWRTFLNMPDDINTELIIELPD